MLEPDDVKTSRPVPRRGGRGNPFLLFDKVNHRLRDHDVQMRNQVETHSQKV